MNNPTVSVNIVILNGEKHIRRCLESVLRQSYSHDQVEINILDNGSSDTTVPIIESLIPHFADFAGVKFTKSLHNHGMWGGQEELLYHSGGNYIVILSADVILEKDFLKNGVAKMNSDGKLGGLQAKIYQFNYTDSFTTEPKRGLIDTCGFQIARSRRILNIGHGASDTGQFNSVKEIFGVEGAVPIFRKEALESIRVLGEITDHDLFWYGEDLDVAWRIHMAGWRQIYDPSVIAWHDRGTTKSHTHGSWLAYIKKVRTRQQIPIHKRRLEWRNTRWTRIKNDYIINVLKDLPSILWREIEVLGYTILFEPAVLKEVPEFFKGIPQMLQKRHAIMKGTRVSPEQIHSYFS